MPAVIAAPELMAQAATDLATIGSTVNAAHMAAAPPTLSVLPAAADEVSASIAHLFNLSNMSSLPAAGKCWQIQVCAGHQVTGRAVSNPAGGTSLNA